MQEQNEVQSRLQETIEKWCQGDEEAVQFIGLLGGISQTFDDLVDKDHAITREQIYELMSNTLIALPRNGFYQRHFQDLQPVMDAALNQWMQANDAERSGKVERLRVSYVTRSAVTPIIHHVFYLIGGRQMARRAAYEINALIFDEPFEAYVGEHAKGGGDGVRGRSGETEGD